MEYRIGIDLGGTAIKMGAVDEEYNVVCSRSVPTAPEFEKAVADMAGCARALAREMGLRLSDFRSVGVGVPSSIDDEGRLVYSNNNNWCDMPLRREMEKYFPIPVYLGNDADCAVVGESLAGAAKGFRNVIMLTLGTGVGGGIIINNRLYSGGDFLGTEPGHFPLVHGGIKCTCGIEGCYEAYASVTALIRQAKEAMELHPESALHEALKNRGEINGRVIFDCAQQGDETALEVIDQYEEYVAHGIGGLISIFRPNIVIIGGGLSAQGEYLMKPLREKVKKYTFNGEAVPVPPIACAVRGNAAGTIGAAFLDRMKN
ncbi:MAG: ROK family protein [Candidatus Limivicinus sp.]